MIYVPQGRYLIGSVAFWGQYCKNKATTIKIDGTLVAPSDYRVIGNTGNWIKFERVNGLKISGGTFDGQGAGLWACKISDKSCPPGATTLAFYNSNNIVISGLTSLNSQMFHVVIDGCQNTKLQEMKISASASSPNTDGLHIEGSSGVTILKTVIGTGDDCVSIGPGTSNIWIENVSCGPGHGISIGSLGWSMQEPGVQNVTVKTTTFRGTQNGLRIKTWARPSNGFVKDVVFQHSVMVNARYPILIDQEYCPDQKNCPVQVSGVKIRDVTYQDIHGTSASQVALKLACSKANPCQGIRLEDIPSQNPMIASDLELKEKARLDTLAAAQVHQQNIDNPGRATNPDDEDLGDEELLKLRHATEVAAPMQRRDHQARLRHDHQAVQIPFDDDDDDMDGAGATGAIIPPPLEPGAKSLNSVTKTVVDNAAGGSFMDLTFIQSSDMLDRMTKKSKAWHTRDSEVANSTVSIGIIAEQRQREEERDQDMVYMKMQMDLLTKHLLSGNTKKVKAVVSQGRDESDFEGSWKNKTDRSVLYVPFGNREAVASGSGKMSMEDLMAKLVKGVEQLSQLSAAFNQRKAGTLPSETVQNPRNDGSCMAITTRSGKVLENLPKGKQAVDDVADNDIDADGEDAVEAGKRGHDVTPIFLQPKKSNNQKQDKKEVVEKMIPLPPPHFPQRLKKKADDIPEKVDNRKQDKEEVVEKTIPLPPPPFPQRLKKKTDDSKFRKFMTMLKQMTINVPLVEALEQMPGYAKFMKDLLTKKRTVSYDMADNVHHCSAIATRLLVQKKADPGAFTIPCTIGSLDFAKALCDWGASINLMPLSIYRKLGLGDPTPTNMRLMMADMLREEAKEHEETVCALTGIRFYSHDPKKLDLDLKNRPSPTMKTSIEEPPVLESKELPSHLRYAFLGSGNTPSVSVAANLGEQHVEALISALKRYKRAMGWTIDDIIGIAPGICMHKSHLKQDCMPTNKHQRRLNPFRK
ncbi:Polygalacturonase [Capsicum baccatum]|uniref:Polygalacturonase n=1 Tax=Capsicum baccatum TaxID=33114 RepID=A0A2G2WAK5_CAPBA|nr:Polygalacturonase [Capsicum baccatum]